MPPYKSIKDRIDGLSVRDPNSGCWLWTGCFSRDGYGMFNPSSAHKASYEAYIGKVPEGLELDHKCKVRCCVNPWHLEPVTHAENVRRGDYKTNHRNKLKTHCKHGHEFTPENTRIEEWAGIVMRKCIICCRAKNKRAFLRRKALKALVNAA